MYKVLNILTIPFSILYWVLFFVVLTVFHVIQWVGLNIFGYQAHKKAVDVMNWFIIKCLLVVGVSYKVKGYRVRESDRPAIIVSNHQSMFDIPPLIWYLRKLHPKFVAKKELARGTPGVSYNLRHGGSVLIDRNNRKAAMEALKLMSGYIEKFDRSVVIFPEGTRSDSPKPLKWREGGLATLIESASKAVIVPVTINGSWKLLKYRGWPIPMGSRVSLHIHEPMSYDGGDLSEFIKSVKQKIESELAINKI